MVLSIRKGKWNPSLLAKLVCLCIPKPACCACVHTQACPLCLCAYTYLSVLASSALRSQDAFLGALVRTYVIFDSTLTPPTPFCGAGDQTQGWHILDNCYFNKLYPSSNEGGNTTIFCSFCDSTRNKLNPRLQTCYAGALLPVHSLSSSPTVLTLETRLALLYPPSVQKRAASPPPCIFLLSLFTCLLHIRR